MTSSVRRWLPPVLAFAILAAAAWLLQRELRGFSPADVAEGIRQVPPARVALALLLVGVCQVILTGVDWLAVRHVGVDQPYRRVGFAAFLGYAFSHALGFSLLTGAPIRYRLYTSWGVEAPDIARVVGFYTLTYWVGLAALAGVVFTVGPAWTAGVLPPSVGGPAGVLLLVAVAAYLIACARRPGSPLGERLGLRMPTARTAAAQVAIGVAEWTTAAGVLYVLLPADLGMGFPAFVGLFVLAQGLGVLSTVPQGLGVFEAVLLTALPDAAVDGGVVAAVVVFRALFYLLPLFLAATILAVLELRRREDALEQALATVGSGVSSATPVVLSGTVFVAGALLLLTGALPLTAPLGWLGRLPLPLLEASHFLGSVAGASLLILAWGLARRMEGAYQATVALLVVGGLFTALMDGNPSGAAFLFVLALGLRAARREFFRPSALTREPLSPEWLVGVVAVLAGTLWLGFWAYRDVALSGDLWWRFALGGDAPRFLRGSVGAATVLAAFGVTRLLRPPEPAAAPTEVDDATSRIIDASPRPSARLAYLGDKHLLRAKSGNALIMYGVAGRSWVSLGDPVGDPDDFEDLVWMFRSRTFRQGGWPVFYQVTPTHLPLYIDAGLALLKLGEEAVVDAQAFSLEGGARAGMRKAVRKAEADGASFEVLEPEAVMAELPRLRAISDAWLTDKKAQEKSFSLGSFSEAYVARFPVAVARVDGQVVAFANMLLGGDGREFSLDLMRYDPATSPPGAMQYLFAKALLWGKERGFARFSLGMAPLSGLESGPLAPLSARLGTLVFRHGEHFYNFQGLRAYKEKFDPVWEPRYLASPGGLALPRIVGSIATLVSGGTRGLLTR